MDIKEFLSRADIHVDVRTSDKTRLLQELSRQALPASICRPSRFRPSRVCLCAVQCPMPGMTWPLKISGLGGPSTLRMPTSPRSIRDSAWSTKV